MRIITQETSLATKFAHAIAGKVAELSLLNNQKLIYRYKKNIYSYLSTFACRMHSHTLAKLL
ncbi:hypothetical protein D4100_09535 [Serratia inhibens]|uniref:Uncharacterized protein n=1 Tax=Serratia inhibens TaxID=2338073 RepID=A0AA92X8S0_9GAMM|nr:hypothetical protein D4100_09535 [Serratia inhibens]